jgi:hypothetical protein
MDNNNQSSNNKSYLGFITLVIIVLLATLPFHYIFYGSLKVIPKDNFTFSNTIITEDDVSKIISRYNDENFIGKIGMRNEPLVKKLLENGILVNDKDSKNSED